MSGRRAHVIAERLGADNADRLARIAGGTRLHVPGQLKNADRLRALLGDDLAVLVVLHFGDSRLYVHRPTRSPNVDVKTVARLTNAGMSARRIALKLGCCDRTVRAKRRTARERGMIRHNPA